MAEEIEGVRKLVTQIVEFLIARAEQRGKQLDSLFVVIDARQAKCNRIRALIVTPHEAESSELELGDYAQNQDAAMSGFKFTGPGGDA